MDTNNKKTWLKLTPILIMAVMMCVARLWFGLFLFFVFGLAVTLITRKRRYCSAYCPLGNLQELVFKPKGKMPVKLSLPRWLFWPVFLGFWAYLAAVTILFIHQPTVLWIWILRFMVIAGVIALLLQQRFGQRVWCGKLCPYGKVLGHTLRVLNKKPVGKIKNATD